MGCVGRDIENLGLCLLAQNQPQKSYIYGMGCVLKDIDKPRSMSASNKPTYLIIAVP